MIIIKQQLMTVEHHTEFPKEFWYYFGGSKNEPTNSLFFPCPRTHTISIWNKFWVVFLKQQKYYTCSLNRVLLGTGLFWIFLLTLTRSLEIKKKKKKFFFTEKEHQANKKVSITDKCYCWAHHNGLIPLHPSPPQKKKNKLLSNF